MMVKYVNLSVAGGRDSLSRWMTSSVVGFVVGSGVSMAKLDGLHHSLA